MVHQIRELEADGIKKICQNRMLGSFRLHLCSNHGLGMMPSRGSYLMFPPSPSPPPSTCHQLLSQWRGGSANATGEHMWPGGWERGGGDPGGTFRPWWDHLSCAPQYVRTLPTRLREKCELSSSVARQYRDICAEHTNYLARCPEDSLANILLPFTVGCKVFLPKVTGGEEGFCSK